jgi:carboxypeptidase family protein
LRVICGVCRLLVAPLAAQDPRGTITGRVMDASSAVIPSVSVRATKVDTNMVATAISIGQGAYEIPYLLPGIYKVDAELKGFRTWTQARVELRAGRRSNKQLGSNIRTFPSRISGARADGIWICDLSLFKTFRVMERIRLQLRGEAEGVMNHPNFAAPNLSPSSSLFGTVNATQTGQEERRIFVGLKLLF